MKTTIKSHPVPIVALLMLVAMVPLMLCRDFTPANELRYLSIADEAIREGHIFAFTNQGEAYADKPPLYFWLMMLMKLVFGKHDIFALSLLSFIPALVIIGVMDKWIMTDACRRGRKLDFGDRFASAIMLGTSALFMGASIFLRMDMLMCMFIVLALFTFYKMYMGIGNTKLNSYLLPLYIFLGLFTKGPVGLLLPPLAIFVFLLSEGKISETGKYLGWKTWGIIAGLCAVWFTGVLIDGGSSYLENLLFHQTVDRAVNAFHHKEPFCYYLVVIWYITAPYSLLLIANMTAAFTDWKSRTAASGLYAAVVLTALVMMSCFSSKLAIYLLPLFPFLVYLFAVQSDKYGNRMWVRVMLAIPSLIFVIAGSVGIVSLAVHNKIPDLAGILRVYDFILSPLSYAVLAVLTAGGMVSMFMLPKKNGWRKAVTSLAVSMLACVFLASFMLPKANDFIGYSNLCSQAQQLADDSGKDCSFVTLYVSRSENMDVFLGKDIISYGRNPDDYLSSDNGNHILMVKASHITEHPQLETRLSEFSYKQVGEYRCYSVLTDS